MLTIQLESIDSFALAVDPSDRKSIRLRARLPVRRVDCRANESIDSNRRHFLPSLKAGLPCFN